MTPLSQQLAEVFLDEVRSLVRSSFFLHRSEKTERTRSELGFTNEQLKEVIESLTAEDFSEIAVELDGSSGTAWVFGKKISGRDIYIKLEISRFSNSGDEKSTLYCWSFHFSDRPMSYPFKSRE
jgi:hypothetical protein